MLERAEDFEQLAMKRLEKIHALEMRLVQGLGPVHSIINTKSISDVKDPVQKSLSSSVKAGGTSSKDKSIGMFCHQLTYPLIHSAYTI